MVVWIIAVMGLVLLAFYWYAAWLASKEQKHYEELKEQWMKELREFHKNK